MASGSNAPLITNALVAWPPPPSSARFGAASPPSTARNTRFSLAAHFTAPLTSPPLTSPPAASVVAFPGASPLTGYGAPRASPDPPSGSGSSGSSTPVRSHSVKHQQPQTPPHNRDYPPPKAPLSPAQLGRIAQSFGIAVPTLGEGATSFPTSSRNTNDRIRSPISPRFSSASPFPSPTVAPNHVVAVIPPTRLLPDLPDTDPEADRMRRIRWRRGRLIPLQPTLGAMLVAIAREFGLPSTVGVTLYLNGSENRRESSSSFDADSAGPEITPATWTTLFAHAARKSMSPASSPISTPRKRNPSAATFGGMMSTISTATPQARVKSLSHSIDAGPSRSTSSASASSSSPHTPVSLSNMSSSMPIFGTIEFDIDPVQARWFDAWIESGGASRRLGPGAEIAAIRELTLVERLKDPRPKFMRQMEEDRERVERLAAERAASEALEAARLAAEREEAEREAEQLRREVEEAERQAAQLRLERQRAESEARRLETERKAREATEAAAAERAAAEREAAEAAALEAAELEAAAERAAAAEREAAEEAEREAAEQAKREAAEQAEREAAKEAEHEAAEQAEREAAAKREAAAAAAEHLLSSRKASPLNGNIRIEDTDRDHDIEELGSPASLAYMTSPTSPGMLSPTSPASANEHRASGMIMADQLTTLEKMVRDLSPKEIRFTAPRPKPGKNASPPMRMADLPARGSSRLPYLRETASHNSTDSLGSHSNNHGTSGPTPPEKESHTSWPAKPFTKSADSPQSPGLQEYFQRPANGVPYSSEMAARGQSAETAHRANHYEGMPGTGGPTKPGPPPKRPARPPTPDLTMPESLPQVLPLELLKNSSHTSPTPPSAATFVNQRPSSVAKQIGRRISYKNLRPKERAHAYAVANTRTEHNVHPREDSTASYQSFSSGFSSGSRRVESYSSADESYLPYQPFPGADEFGSMDADKGAHSPGTGPHRKDGSFTSRLFSFGGRKAKENDDRPMTIVHISSPIATTVKHVHVTPAELAASGAAGGMHVGPLPRNNSLPGSNASSATHSPIPPSAAGIPRPPSVPRSPPNRSPPTLSPSGAPLPTILGFSTPNPSTSTLGPNDARMSADGHPRGSMPNSPTSPRHVRRKPVPGIQGEGQRDSQYDSTIGE